MSKKWLVTFSIALVVATGCSGSSTPSVADAAKVAAGGPAVAASVPSVTPRNDLETKGLPANPVKPPEGAPGGAGGPLPMAAPGASPFPEMGELFAPPKVVIPVIAQEPEPEPEPQPVETEAAAEPVKEKKALPQMRLIGFVEVEGLKALLNINGKLNVVTVGDSADEGLQIIGIEPPAVTLRQGDDGEEVRMNLFEQPWFHQPGAFANERQTVGGKPVIQKSSSAPTMPGMGGGMPTTAMGMSPSGASGMPGGAGGMPGGMPAVPGMGGGPSGPGAGPGGGLGGMPGGGPDMPGVPGNSAGGQSSSGSSKNSSKKSSSRSSSKSSSSASSVGTSAGGMPGGTGGLGGGLGGPGGGLGGPGGGLGGGLGGPSGGLGGGLGGPSGGMGGGVGGPGGGMPGMPGGGAGMPGMP